MNESDVVLVHDTRFVHFRNQGFEEIAETVMKIVTTLGLRNQGIVGNILLR